MERFAPFMPADNGAKSTFTPFDLKAATGRTPTNARRQDGMIIVPTNIKALLIVLMGRSRAKGDA
jgi:hypothetical protein